MRTRNEYDGNRRADGPGFVAGLLIGALLGGCASLLYAPKSGQETRREMKNLADRQKGNLRNQWDSTKATAVEVANTAKEKIDSFDDLVKGMVTEYTDKAKARVDGLADSAKLAVEKIKRSNENLTGENEQVNG